MEKEEAEAAWLSMERVASLLLPRAQFRSKIEEIEGKLVVYTAVEKSLTDSQPVATARGEIYRRESDRNVRIGVEDIHLDVVTEQTRTALVPHIPLTVFIAMSFRDEEEPALVDYFRAMERAAARVNEQIIPKRIDLKRIDLVEVDFEISHKIMEEIETADALLADFTLSPANDFRQVETNWMKSKNGINAVQTAGAGSLATRNS